MCLYKLIILNQFQPFFYRLIFNTTEGDMSFSSYIQSIENHIKKLRDKHARLDETLNSECVRPQPDQSRIIDLKHQKLKIKDEIFTLKQTT